MNNVQAAINGGGTVILKATNVAGQPIAFNFGVNSGADLTNSVTILGERVGQSMTTISGGFWPFLGFTPVHTHIEGINFEGPTDAAILLLVSTGTEIVGNRIRGVVPRLLGGVGFTEAQGVYVSAAFPTAIIGKIKITGNDIQISDGDFANGIQFDQIFADIEISQNSVFVQTPTGVIQTFGISITRSHGKVNVVSNMVTLGSSGPDALATAIAFDHGYPEGRYTISGNTVVSVPNLANGISVFGDPRLTQSVMIANNHVTINTSFGVAIALAGLVENSHVNENQIEGTSLNAVDFASLDPILAPRYNHAATNDISKHVASQSDVYFASDTIGNNFAGECATYIDLGIGNQINCGQQLSAFASTAQVTEGKRNLKPDPRIENIRQAILGTIPSRVPR